MHLWGCHQGKSCTFTGPSNPPYAVVVRADDSCKAVASRSECISTVGQACQAVLDNGVELLWSTMMYVDTPAADRQTRSITGYRKILTQAAVCLVYLNDVASSEVDSRLDESAYWARAWMIPEVALPRRVEFYDAEWNHVGSKTSPNFSAKLAVLTGIDETVLLDPSRLRNTPLAIQISWASKLGDVSEDVVYGLAVLLGIHMAARHDAGGEQEFIRLQRKILRETSDGSIFAWVSDRSEETEGLLSRSPAWFRHFARANSPDDGQGQWVLDAEIESSNKGMKIQGRLLGVGSDIVMEIARRGQGTQRLGIFLRRSEGLLVRSRPGQLVRFTGVGSVCSFRASWTIREPSPPTPPQVLGKRKDAPDSSACATSETWTSDSDMEDAKPAIAAESAQPPLKRRSRTASPSPHKKQDTRLLCPFAVSDPAKHHTCTTSHPLRSNGAVARHLRKHHRQPPYCPICRSLFATDAQRDDHIVLRKCELKDATPIGGLTSAQVARLVPFANLTDVSEKTWTRIFRVAFPDATLQ